MWAVRWAGLRNNKRWIIGLKSLVILFDKAKEIKNSPFKKLLITNGRRLFVTKVSVENMVTRKNLDLAYEWQILADDIKHLHLIDDN
jgi:hypothetical protein